MTNTYADAISEKCAELRLRAANLMTDPKDKKHCAAGQAYLDCAEEFEALKNALKDTQP